MATYDMILCTQSDMSSKESSCPPCRFGDITKPNVGWRMTECAAHLLGVRPSHCRRVASTLELRLGRVGLGHFSTG